MTEYQMIESMYLQPVQFEAGSNINVNFTGCSMKTRS